MIKTVIDISKRNLVETGIKKVTLLGQELKFIEDKDESLSYDGNLLTISNATHTGIKPCLPDENAKIEIVSEWVDLDNHQNRIEIVSYAYIREVISVTRKSGNSRGILNGDTITIEIDDMKYYTYVKDDIEELYDEIDRLKSDICEQKNIIDQLLGKSYKQQDVIDKLKNVFC